MALDGDTVVVVEVKARRGTGFGLPEEAVDAAKQRRLRRLAATYLAATGRHDASCRIDVIGLMVDSSLVVRSLNHIIDAVGGELTELVSGFRDEPLAAGHSYLGRRPGQWESPGNQEECDAVTPKDRRTRLFVALALVGAAATMSVATWLTTLRLMGRSGELTSGGIFDLLTIAMGFAAALACVLLARSVTQSEGKRLHESLHDSLTLLPNRALFTDRVTHEIVRQRRRDKRSLALIFLDIDGFKAINDTMGRDVGNALLIAVSDRINETLRPGDSVARLGADEFGILVESLDSVELATNVADRILASLKPAFDVDGQEVFLGACIGIATPITGDEDAATLVQHADLAMHRAREIGKNAIEVFQPAMASLARQRLDMENELRGAADRGELQLYYQPIVDLPNRQTVSLEALLRWIHPVRGIIPPMEFIPLAEQSGLIVPIGRWVLRTACTQLQEWHTSVPDFRHLTVSVNLSARQLRDPELVNDVKVIVEETGLDPGSLTLEVTESMLIDNVTDSVAKLHALRAMGIRIALDDFGTGYSSLSYIQQMPLDAIKIDRSFVMKINDDQTSSAVARSIVTLGRTLELGVIAEGIETTVQLDELLRIGCMVGQGFHFAKPVPGDELEAALEGCRPASARRGPREEKV